MAARAHAPAIGSDDAVPVAAAPAARAAVQLTMSAGELTTPVCDGCLCVAARMLEEWHYFWRRGREQIR